MNGPVSALSAIEKGHKFYLTQMYVRSREESEIRITSQTDQANKALCETNKNHLPGILGSSSELSYKDICESGHHRIAHKHRI